MKIIHDNKTINIKIKRTNFLTKISGLMFRTRKTKNLYFEFFSPSIASIHSYFVFFPFLALWLDEKNKVVDFQIVKPFTAFAKSKSPSRKLIEIPINKKNKKIIKIFVDKERFK